MVYLFLTCRQLDFASAVNYAGLRPEPERRAGSIHCHVSATYDHRLVTGPDRRRVVFAECHHQVVSREEFVRGEYSVEVFARDSHEFRQACSGAYEYCVKSFFIEQRVHSNCPSCNDIRLYLDA